MTNLQKHGDVRKKKLFQTLLVLFVALPPPFVVDLAWEADQTRSYLFLESFLGRGQF